jgi:hypothetical protein
MHRELKEVSIYCENEIKIIFPGIALGLRNVSAVHEVKY